MKLSADRIYRAISEQADAVLIGCIRDEPGLERPRIFVSPSDCEPDRTYFLFSEAPEAMPVPQAGLIVLCGS